MQNGTLAPGARLDGRYELVARLGDGTFGEVWRAVDTRLSQRPVAVKVLKGEFLARPDMVARFEAEADALARLAHPNVVSVLDRGREGDARYIVTELVEGDSLAAWLDRARASGAPTGLATVRALFDQVCAGVEAAHQVEVPGPIVHRDLKPENVIVRTTQSGDVLAKVLDFGIAQLGGRHGTSTGMLLGTPRYMAPEQAMGQVAGVGPWSDVFALAVLLVEMLTLRSNSVGEETWWGTSLRTNGDVLPLLQGMRADVPEPVWHAVARALHPTPTQRPSNAAMLRATLRAAWDQPAAPAVPKTMAMGAFAPMQPPTMAMNAFPPVGQTQAMPGFASAHGSTAAPWQPMPMPTPTVVSGSSPLFGVAVMGGLFVALLVASGVWYAQRQPHTTTATAAAPTVPPPVLPTPAPPMPPTPTRPRIDDPDRLYVVRDNPDAPAQGPASAPVTIQCFSDFQCPFCGRVNPTLERLRERYGDQLRLVWRNYPLAFHQNAMPAAEAAMEVQRQLGDRGFWRYHAMLFDNQRALTADDLARYAEAVGANARRVRQALEDHRHQRAVRDDMAAFDASGASAGTPSFFINGRLLRGAQPYERFTAAVDRALEEGRANP